MSNLPASPNLWFECGEESLQVRTIVARERMNDVFAAKVVARTLKQDLVLDDFVGKSASVAAITHYGKMLWTGVCARMEVVQIEETDEGLSTYELTIVPKLWLLNHRKNHRIFQHKQTREIVTEILAEYDIKPKFRLTEKHPVHEYRVQHGETDFSFVNRLLEEAGITYYFERKDDECMLLLADAPGSMPSSGAIDFFDTPNDGSINSLFVTDVKVGHGVRPGKATIIDYDFRKPRLLLEHESSFPLPEGETVEEKYEQYFYMHGGTVIDGAEAKDKLPVADESSVARHDKGQLQARTERVAEANRFARRHVEARTNHPELYASRTFSIDRHPRSELASDKVLLVIDSTTTITELDWWVDVTAVQAETPYRPELRTPKPKVLGPQTAVVVGPPGAKGKQKEIFVDEHGRVHVQFHWDRLGKYNSRSTCWLRVSQSWAGAGYGQMMVPRIGQEVLVDFFDGDPDQPVVTGRLYNNTTRVPRVLPTHETQTILRTATSPHKDAAFNEITLEDKVDNEQFFVQAERDLFKLVKRHDTDRTGNNRLTIVGEGRVAGVQRSDALQVGERLMVRMVKTGDFKIVEMGDPEYEELDTLLHMSDGQIAITTGEASVVLAGDSIYVDADGSLRFTTDGRLIMQGSMVYLNTQDGTTTVDPQATVKDATQKPTRKLKEEPPPEAEAPEVVEPEQVAEAEVKVIRAEPREKEEVEPPPPCTLVSAKVECAHGSGKGGGGREVPLNGLLETLLPDTISGEIDVTGACANHPRWSFSHPKLLNKESPQKQRFIGNKVKYILGGYSESVTQEKNEGGSDTLAAYFETLRWLYYLWGVENSGVEDYSITVTTCHDQRTFKLRGYPESDIDLKVIPAPIKKFLDSVKTFVERYVQVPKSKWGDRLKFKFLEGDGKIVAGFKETGHNSCFFKLVLTVGFMPLISITMRLIIPLPGPLYVINEILDLLGIARIEVFLEGSAGVDLTGSAGKNAPGVSLGASVDCKLTLGVKLGVSLTAAEAITAEVSASTEFVVPGGIELVLGNIQTYYGPIEVGALKGTFALTIHSARIERLMSPIRTWRIFKEYGQYFTADNKIEITRTFRQSDYLVGRRAQTWMA